MVKLQKYTNKGVTVKDSERVVISKPLFNIIVSIQREMQDKENKKKVGKKKKISFVYASLCLERSYKRK